MPMRGRGKGEGRGDEFGLGFGGLLRGLSGVMDLLSEMAEAGQREIVRTGEIRGLSDKVRGVYGFSIRTGLGDTPVIETFGNIRETESGPVVADVREPLIDVFDEGEKIVVVAELPGVEEDSISVELSGDILALEAKGGERKYFKEILLPCAPLPGPRERSCRNGILRLVFDKPAASQEERHEEA